MRQVLEQNNSIESHAKIKNTVTFITEIFVQTSKNHQDSMLNITKHIKVEI